MCGVCGCDSEKLISTRGNNRVFNSIRSIESVHEHKGHSHAHEHKPAQRIIDVEQAILHSNDRIADKNRALFNQRGQLALNLVSSPGSGKTTLLTETLKLLKMGVDCAVIEGDQQTDNDAERIRATNTPAIQVNTGKGCHLDAAMVAHAVEHLDFTGPGIVFIENVGNLVCPASFDLGEQYKVAILSVTEGEDKPLKYPYMFAESEYMIINKIDLIDYVDFDIENCIQNARSINPHIKVIQLSATKHTGMEAWLSILEEQLATVSSSQKDVTI